MGKMQFGSEAVKSRPSAEKQVEYVEKIVEVPVEVIREVQVIKEIPTIKSRPVNTDIPAKYDDEKLEELRKDVLKKIIESNDKITSIKTKNGDISKKLKEFEVSIEEKTESIIQAMNDSNPAKDIKKLYSENELLREEIKIIREEFDLSLKINYILGGLVLLSLVLHLF